MINRRFSRVPTFCRRPAFAAAVAICALTAFSAPVCAQTPDEKKQPSVLGTSQEDTFDAFRKKIAEERQKQQQAVAADTAAIAAPAASTDAPPAVSPVVSPAAEMPPAAAPVSPVDAIPASPATSGMATAVDGGMVGTPDNPLGPAADLPLSGQPQSQSEIQSALEAESKRRVKETEDATFDAAVKQLMPLRPDQVRNLLGKFKENREAAETPIAEPAPKQIVQTLSLDPSELPPVIKLAPGNVTTVTVLDATGAPWPIQDVSWAGKFQVTPPEEGGHILRITPQTAHGTGNISIRLVDLIAPVTMTLKSGLDEVYYRFDARVPKSGPLAKAPLIEYGGLKSVAGKDADMSQLLDGTPPVNAEKLKVVGADGRTTAFRIKDKVYLRTPLTLLSPGWDSSATSADGVNVYSIPAAPVILLSDQGRMVETRIAEDEGR